MPERKSLLKQSANEQNAQKSTGPTTTQGKARSARNACKHGILARQVVIAHVDGGGAAEFHELLEDLHAEFQPQGAVEHALLDRVAACYWRLRRAQRYEVGAVSDALEQDETDDWHGRRTAVIESVIRQASLALEIHKRRLGVLRRPVARLGREDQKEREVALRAAAAAMQPPAQDLDDPAVLQAAIQAREDHIAKTEALIRDWEGGTNEAEKKDLDSWAFRLPLLAALPKDDALNRLIRYETMLDRQLHRALRELRCRQARRRPDRKPPTSDFASPSEPRP